MSHSIPNLDDIIAPAISSTSPGQLPFKPVPEEIASITDVNTINALAERASEIDEKRRLASFASPLFTNEEILIWAHIFKQRRLVDRTFSTSYDWEIFMAKKEHLRQEGLSQEQTDLLQVVGAVKL